MVIIWIVEFVDGLRRAGFVQCRWRLRDDI